MTSTISRSATKRINALKASHTVCVVRELRDGFAQSTCPAEKAWEALAGFRSARLVDHGDHLRVNVHGNLWFELRDAS